MASSCVPMHVGLVIPPPARQARNLFPSTHGGVTATTSWKGGCEAPGTVRYTRRVVVPGGTRGITSTRYFPPEAVNVTGTMLQSGSPPACGGYESVKSSSSVASVGIPVSHRGTAWASTFPGFSITRSNAVRRSCLTTWLPDCSVGPTTDTLSCGASTATTEKPFASVAV